MPLPESVRTVLVTLDKPRRMALTLGAMRRMKEQTGLSVTSLGEMPEEARLDHLHEFVWALLVNEDREGLTPADLEEMIHAGNMGEVAEAFVAVLYEPLPAAKGAEGNGVPAPPVVKAGKKSRRR